MLILLLVLLVPIRYNVKGRYNEQLKAKVSVSWLLKLIHVKLEAIQLQIRVRICVLGFAVKKMYLGNWGDEAPDKQKDKDQEEAPEEGGGKAPAAADEKTDGGAAEKAPDKAAEKEKEGAQKAKQAEASTVVPEYGEDDIFALEKEPAPAEEAAKPEEKKEEGDKAPETADAAAAETPAAEQKKDRFDRLFDKLEKKAAEKQAELDALKAEKDKKTGETPEQKEEKASGEAQAQPEETTEEEKQEENFLEQALDWVDKISDFWDDEKNQKAVWLIERQLLRLGRHLLPTKLKVEGELGLGDPSKTGALVGKIYSLYPLYGDHIRIDGVYDEKRTNIYAELGGRLRLGVFVEIALRLLLNARIRRWLKKVLKKDKDAGGNNDVGKQEQI